MVMRLMRSGGKRTNGAAPKAGEAETGGVGTGRNVLWRQAR